MRSRPLFRAEAPGRARPRPWAVAAWLSASLLLGTAGVVASSAKAQSVKSSAAPQAAPTKPASKPLWRELTARQQKALQPLAPYWDDLTEPHKRKWLALSRDYAKMSATDQEVLHSRMTEWARLSNQERAQARANFANVKQVPADERKAKWEAYQALSDEEKSKLAARAKVTKAPGAAPTIRPIPEQKLVPIVPAVGQDGQHTPRIQLNPPPAPVASVRPVPVPAPALAPAAAPTPAFPPVSAEAQVPPPAAADNAPKVSEQPPSAP